MKPLKERIDERVWLSAMEICKSSGVSPDSLFYTNSSQHLKHMANWMQDEMQKEIDELVEALKIAYLKHNCGDDSIGWDELSTILHFSLCNAIGDDAYCDWIAKHKEG